MKIYLFFTCLLFAVLANNCQQIGNSTVARLSACSVLTPPPQLKWAINITLLQDYDWRGSQQVKYFYMKLNDQPIDETCYQGQTIKGKYSKGSTLIVEHLCFNFTPSITKGDKLYVMIFWDKSGDQQQVIYLSFSANGQIQNSGQVSGEELKHVQLLFDKKNLITQ